MHPTFPIYLVGSPKRGVYRDHAHDVLPVFLILDIDV